MKTSEPLHLAGRATSSWGAREGAAGEHGGTSGEDNLPRAGRCGGRRSSGGSRPQTFFPSALSNSAAVSRCWADVMKSVLGGGHLYFGT